MENIQTYANDLLEFFHQQKELQNKPTVNFEEDEENGQNPLGKTGFYDPAEQSITIFITGRHVKDCLRSLAHELVHHMQNERGAFEDCGATVEGYAQNDPHLREMEREAYEQGNLCFRDWEDNLKTTNKQLYETIYKTSIDKGDAIMSAKDWKNNELNTILMEKWGFAPKGEKQVLKEEVSAYYNTSKGGDYKTGQEEYPADGEETLEEDEENEGETLEAHPAAAGSRSKKAPKYTKTEELEEQKLRKTIRSLIKELA